MEDIELINSLTENEELELINGGAIVRQSEDGVYVINPDYKVWFHRGGMIKR